MQSTIDTGRTGAPESFMTALDHLLTQLTLGPLEGETAIAGVGQRLMAEVQRLLQAGGKRLRPHLLDLGYRAAGGDGLEHLPAAAAVELLHTFALIQDDVMDGASLRRGAPSAAHSLAEIAPRRLQNGISGGESLAILASDLALIKAEQAFRSLALRPERLLLGQHYWDLLRYELAAGQALDLMLTGRPPWKEAEVLQVADYKSGRYTVLRPLQIGAALGGWSGVLLEQWSLVGLPIGIAFQIQDDLLALTGKPAETGKDGASDIRDGKATLPMALAFQRAKPQQKELLLRTLGNPATTDQEIAQVLQVLEDTRSLGAARAMVEQLLAFGVERMRRLPIALEWRLAFEEMVARLALRTH